MIDTTIYAERVLESNQEFVLHFPQYIKEAITEYTRSVQINRLLRTNKLVMTPKRTKRTGQYETMLRRMDRAFAYIPYLEHEITVYRGIVSDNFYTDDAGYVSTSTSITGTEGFIGSSCCILQITIPVHSKVIRIPGVIGFHGDEHEVLLDRGGRFIRSSEPDDDYKGRRKIHLLYIPYQKDHISMDDKRYDMGIEIKRSIERKTKEKERERFLDDIYDVASDGRCDELEQMLKDKGEIITRDRLNMMVDETIPQKCVKLMIEHTDNPNLKEVILKVGTPIPMIDFLLSIDNSFKFKNHLITRLIDLDRAYHKQQYKDRIKHIVDTYEVDDEIINFLIPYYVEIQDFQSLINLIEKYKAYRVFSTHAGIITPFLVKQSQDIVSKYEKYIKIPIQGDVIGLSHLKEEELEQFWIDVFETNDLSFIQKSMDNYGSYFRPSPTISKYMELYGLQV